MDSCGSKALSVRAASKEGNVPYSTARNLILGLQLRAIGGQLKYSAEEEQLLADFVLSCADFGVPLTKQLLKNALIDYEKEKGKPTALHTWHVLTEFVLSRRSAFGRDCS